MIARWTKYFCGRVHIAFSAEILIWMLRCHASTCPSFVTDMLAVIFSPWPLWWVFEIHAMFLLASRMAYQNTIPQITQNVNIAVALSHRWNEGHRGATYNQLNCKNSQEKQGIEDRLSVPALSTGMLSWSQKICKHKMFLIFTYLNS